MKQLQQYILEVLGVEIQLEVIHKKELGMLPLFIHETYRLYNAKLFNQAIVLAEKMDNAEFSILQTEKHFKLIGEAFSKKVILFAQEMSSLNRKRLVEKGINFVVPGKQLYFPCFLIDLKEEFTIVKNTSKKESLLPSAQFIVLFRILQRNSNIKIEELSFKELAKKLYYTPMAVTYAAENLKYHDICTIVGEKEKYIRFNLEISEMWHDIEKRKLLVNPVLKKIFVDEKPKGIYMLHSNTSALPEYSDMNPSRQEYFAIDKTVFYGLVKNNVLINANENEGKYCIEAWKYNPLTLASLMKNEMSVVDPLSLYLSLKSKHDERIESALEQIIQKFIW